MGKTVSNKHWDYIFEILKITELKKSMNTTRVYKKIKTLFERTSKI